VDDESDVISQSMQLVAGRTAQAFNCRKSRKGAFWEDRYHATAIESGEHLLRCLIYMDMNTVRAGVVSHPSEWRESGYHEIQHPPQRYRLIDRERLIALTGLRDDGELASLHREWIEDACGKSLARQAKWIEAVAVGSESFVVDIQKRMRASVLGRQISASADAYILREPEAVYSIRFEDKKVSLSLENTAYFDGSA